jgi:hypothetical protein
MGCLGLVLLLTGCTYSEREPGLFGRLLAPSPTETLPPTPTPVPAAIDPDRFRSTVDRLNR